MEVRDGGTLMAPRLGRRYCRDRLPPSLVTSGNVALISYFSNTSEPRGGFTARVSIGRSVAVASLACPLSLTERVAPRVQSRVEALPDRGRLECFS